MSTDEMIGCLGSCRARSEIAAMIKALSLDPSLNTPDETKRLEAARAAMENWKSYSHACQVRHNAHRLRLGHAKPDRGIASPPPGSSPRALSDESWAASGVIVWGMTNPFRYFNSSPEVIRLVVMMYVRYPLSLRNVEDLLAERGIDISYETVRFWWNRFGPMFAAEIRKKRVAHMRGYPQWRWHVDEVFVKVNGKLRYLWRAVDHEGEVLEAVVTARRDKTSALKLLKRIMKRYGQAQSVVTDGLRAHSAAMDEIGAADRHEVGRRLNNRAENSHQPFRRRERAMQRFRSMKTLQKFSSVHAQLHNHFNQERNLVTRETYKQRRSAALAEWRALAA